MTQSPRLYLVRHGETDWNVAGRIQGHTPTDLNENGRAQARKAGEVLRGHPFEAAYSSDLPRAYQTAELMLEAAESALPVVRTEKLRERHFGEYEGFNSAQIHAARTSLGLPQTGDLADWTGMPGIESNVTVWERVSAELKVFSERHTGDVLVVTHGGVLSRVVYAVLGIADGMPRRFPLSNGMLTIVQWRNDAWYLLRLTDLGEGNKDTSVVTRSA